VCTPTGAIVTQQKQAILFLPVDTRIRNIPFVKKIGTFVTISVYESVKPTKTRNGSIHFITQRVEWAHVWWTGYKFFLHVPFPISITSLNNSTQKRHSASWISGERKVYRISNLLLECEIAILSVTLTVPRCVTSRFSSDMKAGTNYFLISLSNFIFYPQCLQDNVH
jgi:hypothetical protein